MRRTSLAAFMLILLFAGAADGLMDALGPNLFLLVGALVMGLAFYLEEAYGRGGEKHDKKRSRGYFERAI